MPLKAMCGVTIIYSFEYDPIQWAKLKTSYNNKSLTMTCCGNEAIPKTSVLGTFFFAHKKVGECNAAPESAEHLYIKALIAKAAIGAGWKVITERPGKTPDGEQWVADVYCEKGKAHIALEIQMSYQSRGEMEIRQKRYEKSGVRCCWFLASTAFKQNYYKPSKETPAFIFSTDDAIKKEPYIVSFDVGITEFVTGLLGGRLSWDKCPSEYHLHYINDTCFKCHAPVKQVYGFNIDVYGDAAKTIPNASTVLAEIQKIISNEDLRQLGLNTIGRFDKLHGKVVNFPYSNACLHCGAPQNNYYLLKNIETAHLNNNGFGLGSATYLKDENDGAWLFNEVASDELAD